MRSRRDEATQVLGNTTKWFKAAAAAANDQNTHTYPNTQTFALLSMTHKTRN